MAESAKTGNPAVTAENPIIEVLTAPLTEDSTVERLAERLLSSMAQSDAPHPFTFDMANATDRQARRLLRPLLACLALKSATEAGTDVSVYGGSLSFNRPGPHGPVLIVGRFDNKQDNAHITLQRYSPVADTPAADPRAEAHCTSSAPETNGVNQSRAKQP